MASPGNSIWRSVPTGATLITPAGRLRGGGGGGVGGGRYQFRCMQPASWSDRRRWDDGAIRVRFRRWWLLWRCRSPARIIRSACVYWDVCRPQKRIWKMASATTGARPWRTAEQYNDVRGCCDKANARCMTGRRPARMCYDRKLITV